MKIVWFFLWVIVVGLTVVIANGKNRSGLLWGILAAFFPVITLIIVFLLPENRTR